MRFFLEINNQTSCKFSKEYFWEIIEKTIKLSGKKSGRGILDVSLAIVSEKEITRINRTFRKKNKVTDVISFSDYSSRSKEKEGNFFCEIIVCYPYVSNSAQKNKVTPKKEMAYIISHGILHCLGFEHGEKMYKIQDQVTDNFK